MGLPRVAEAAVLKGMAWVISNSDVDFVKNLRKSSRVPVFTVTQGQHEVGRIQSKQIAALPPQGAPSYTLRDPALGVASTY
jgi:hypothetical protein